MLILDTDLLTILQEESEPACSRLAARLDQAPTEVVSVTVVTFQERMQGWLSVLNGARTPSRLVGAYAKLEKLLQSFCKMQILSCDQPEHERGARAGLCVCYCRGRAQGLRIGLGGVP